MTRYEGQIKDVLPTPEKVNDLFSITPVLKSPTPMVCCGWIDCASAYSAHRCEKCADDPSAALGDPVGDNRYKVKLLRNGKHASVK